MTRPDAGLITSLPASDPGSTATWGTKKIIGQAKDVESATEFIF